MTLLMAVLVSVFFLDVVFQRRTLLTSLLVAPLKPGLPAFGYPGEKPRVNVYVLDPLASGGQHEPLVRKMSELIKDLQLPLWNPHSALGRPLLGSSSPLDSPLRFPIDIWPGPGVWDAYLVVRFLVGGVFTYLLARRLGMAPIPAFGSGVAFAFSGYSMLRVNMGHADFAMMIPVTLYSLELLLVRPGPGRLAFASIAVALGILADNPETALLLVLFATCYAVTRILVRASRKGDAEVIRRTILVLAAVGLGTALTAFSMLPFLQLVGYLGFERQSTGLHLGERVLGTLADSPRVAVTYLLPFLDGAPLRNFRGGFTPVRDYLGVGASFLALLGLANRPFTRRAGWFFMGAAVLIVAKIYGVPVVNWIGHLPVLKSVIFPRYAPPLATFSIAMLAGAGLDLLWRGRERWWYPAAGAAVVGAVLAGLVLLFGQFLPTVPAEHQRAQLVFAAGLLGMAAAGAAAVAWRRRIAASFLVGLVALELFAFTLPVKGEMAGLTRILFPSERMKVVERPQRYDAFTEAPFVRFLRHDSSAYRIVGLDLVLRANASAAFGIDHVKELHPLKVARSAHLIQDIVFQWIPTDIPELPGRGNGFTIHNRLLDALNVKYVLSTKTDLSRFAPDQFQLVYAGEVRIYRNRNAFPRAFMVHRAEFVSGRDEAAERLRTADFDPATTAVVEGELPPDQRAALTGANAAGTSRVEVVDYQATEVVLDVRTDRPGLLVLSDAYYPGWKAFVDGEARAVHPTNLALRSVFLEPGRHEVRFVFEPAPFRVGAAISLLVLGGLLGFGLWSRLRRRAEDASSPKS